MKGLLESLSWIIQITQLDFFSQRAGKSLSSTVSQSINRNGELQATPRCDWIIDLLCDWCSRLSVTALRLLLLRVPDAGADSDLRSGARQRGVVGAELRVEDAWMELQS